MKLSPSHLKRYRQIARLLWKYGRLDLAKQMGLPDDPEGSRDPKDDTPSLPEQLVDDLEAMGPTYVKLGQVLAGRPDLLPQAFTAALARLQDNVKPFSYAEVEQIVTSELGVRISKAFEYFEPEPLAAASLGQVHLAALRDGRPVAVKVQRPDIRRQIAEDFEVLEDITAFIDTHTELGRRNRFGAVLEEFRVTIRQELDYEREAHNLVTVAQNLQEFKLLEVPQPVPDYCTRSVLTMDYVQGRKITALGPLARLEMDSTPLVEQLFQAYLKQVLIDGLFHADPHPGNVFLTTDGRIALLDLGMVGHTAPDMQDHLLKLLLAVADGKSDEASDIIIAISRKNEEPDLPEFRHKVTQIVMQTQDSDLQQLKIGGSLVGLSRAASQCGLFVPSELTLLGKTLLQLEEVGSTLDPEFNPNAAVRRHATELMTRRMERDQSQHTLFSTILDVKNFLRVLPDRLNHVLNAVTEDGVEVKVKAVDAKMVVDGMHKIANRITAGMVLAALIVGASLLMRIETNFQIFGYPGLAILCFLGAAGGGFWLVLSIFFHDEKVLRKPPR